MGLVKRAYPGTVAWWLTLPGWAIMLRYTNVSYGPRLLWNTPSEVIAVLVGRWTFRLTRRHVGAYFGVETFVPEPATDGL